MSFFKMTLMCQERRALHEKHRESRHSNIGHTIGQVRPVTFVRKRAATLTQRGEKALKGSHSP